MNPDLYIVILSAGLSQRLGFAKQLILKNGITLLEEKIRLALNFSHTSLVVIPEIDTPWAKQIFDICQRFAVQIVPNPTPHTGMAQSIQLACTALQRQNATKNARVLFLTIDQFALNADHLTQLTQATDDQTLLASRYQHENTSAVMGIPVNMPLKFLTTFAPQLQGDKGFGKLLNQLSQVATGYQVLPIDTPELVWDIDTPEQFESLKKAFGLMASF